MLEIMDLNGTWELHPVAEFSRLWLSEAAPEEGWVTQEIPAQWQEHDSFPSYAGKMLYRRHFAFSPQDGQLYRLEINGVFYKYRVYLNGYALGGTEGYFYPTCFNITPYLREENVLLLEVDCPGPDRDAAYESMLTGIFSGHPFYPESYNPGGIWQPVRILSSGPAFIENWKLRTDTLSGDEATLNLELEIYSTAETIITIKLKLEPSNFKGTEFSREFNFTLQKGTNTFTCQFELKGVQPWWTWELGAPNLYRIGLQLEVAGEVWDHESSLFGIRIFELRNFIPYLNEEPFLIKGSNYLPPSLYLSKMSEKEYAPDIALLKKSHQNMVRAYNHIGTSTFYQAMDKAGILVWQDFPLRPDYPFIHLTGISHQIDEMFRFLGNHPSVVLWTLYNQSGYEQNDGNKREIPRNKLEKLAVRLKEIDPTRPVITDSGTNQPLTNSDTSFNYQIPTDVFKFDRYRRGFRQRAIRFVSWFGRPSFSPQNQQQEERILIRGTTLPETWKQCKTREELTSLSQQEQGELLRFYIDRLRFHKYNPTGGMLFFCFRDLEPGVFWSVVDHQGVPKESFNMISLCYRPIYVFALLPKEYFRVKDLVQFPICFSNDQHGTGLVPVAVKARFTDPRGYLVWKGQWTVNRISDEKSKILDEVSVMVMQKGVYTLTLNWDEQGEIIENRYQVLVK